MIIALVGAFTAYFFYANRKQQQDAKIIEETVGHNAKNSLGLDGSLTSFIGGFSVYVLNLQTFRCVSHNCRAGEGSYSKSIISVEARGHFFLCHRDRKSI